MAMIDSESRDMNWNLTDDQQMVRDMVREFVVAEVAPNAADWDRDKYFPSEMFEVEDEQMLKVQLLGKNFPNPIGLAAGFDKSAEAYNCLLYTSDAADE